MTTFYWEEASGNYWYNQIEIKPAQENFTNAICAVLHFLNPTVEGEAIIIPNGCTDTNPTYYFEDVAPLIKSSNKFCVVSVCEDVLELSMSIRFEDGKLIEECHV